MIRTLGRLFGWPAALLLLGAAAAMLMAPFLNVPDVIPPTLKPMAWLVPGASGAFLLIGLVLREPTFEEFGSRFRRALRWLLMVALYALFFFYLASTVAWIVYQRGDLWWQSFFLLPALGCLFVASTLDQARQRILAFRTVEPVLLTPEIEQPRVVQEIDGAVPRVTRDIVRRLIGFTIFAAAGVLWLPWEEFLFGGFDATPADYSTLVPETPGFFEFIERASVLVVLVAFVGIVALGGRIARVLWLRRRYYDTDRNLAPLELEHIERSFAALATYIDTRVYPPSYGTFKVVGYALIFLGLGIVSLVALGLNEAITLFHSNAQPVGWTFYVDKTGFGSVLLILWAPAFFGAIAAYSGALWPTYAEYSGQRELLSPRRSIEQRQAFVTKLLVEEVRIGETTVGRPFDPGAFLRSVPGRHRQIWLLAALVMSMVTGVLLYYDVRSYEYYTDDGILLVEDWTLEEHFVEYDRLNSIWISCYINREEEWATLYYTISLGNYTFVHFDTSGRFFDLLDQYERIDRNAIRGGTAVYADGKHAIDVPGGIQLDDECILYLERNYSADVRERLYRLFHISTSSEFLNIMPPLP